MRKQQLVKALDHLDPRDRGLAPHAKAMLAKSEHFMFDHALAIDDDVTASIVAMREAGVWHLPFPVCTFELLVHARLHGALEAQAFASWWIIICRDDVPGFVDQIWIETRPKGPWISATHDQYAMADCREVVGAMLVTLVTRGIKQERWIGNKPVVRDGFTSYKVYTRVLISEALIQGDGTRVIGANGRKAVRLHLRRGHVRHQRHGLGNSQIKLVFIEPCLVGYAEMGEVHHQEYQVRAPLAPGVTI
jgi:hypothetical protein